jgi:hypothetical protein
VKSNFGVGWVILNHFLPLKIRMFIKWANQPCFTQYPWCPRSQISTSIRSLMASSCVKLGYSQGLSGGGTVNHVC